MRYGMNLLLWTDTLTDEALPLLDQIKEIGFDAVELPVFEIDAGKIRQMGQTTRRRLAWRGRARAFAASTTIR